MGQFERALSEYQRDADFRAALDRGFAQDSDLDVRVRSAIDDGVLPADVTTWRQVNKAAAHFIAQGQEPAAAARQATMMTDYVAAARAHRTSPSDETRARFLEVYDRVLGRRA